MLLAAVIGLISAWVFYKGLKGGTPNENSSIKTEKPGTKELVKVGLRSMKNPRIALSFAATFLARADVSVNGLFISQWAIISGNAMGLTPSESMLKVVPVIVITNLISVFWAFIFGWIIDRINRVTAMTIAMGMGMIAYSLIITVDSPLDMSNLPIFIPSPFEAAPRCVSRTCPTFIRDGTPNGFNTISTGSPFSSYGMSSTGMITEITPLLPWRPAILSPG